MSLISQNALRKRQVAEVKEDEPNDILLLEESEETEDVKEKKKKKRKDKHKEDTKQKDEEVKEIKKRKKVQNEDKKQIEEEERAMKMHESFLFGSLYPLGEFGREEDSTGEVDGGASLFFTDRSASKIVATCEEEVEYQGRNEDNEMEIRKAVWVDEEEEITRVDVGRKTRAKKLKAEEDETLIGGSEYVSRSRAQFVKLNPGTEWAQRGPQVRNDDESDEELGVVVDYGDQDNEGNDSILRSNEDLVVKSSVKLSPGLLEYSRLVDANAEDPSNASINSVQFHRNAQLLLAAGFDRRLRFFQVDGKRNPMIQSVFLEDCPILKASFLPDGSQVIVGGRRKFFYSFDLANAKFDRIGPLTGRDEKSLEVFEVSPDSRTIAFVGNEGYILLVSCKTKELIGTLKMNGSARSLAFNDDGTQLMSSGGDGHIYHWDLRTRTCFHKAVDEGCIMGSALGTSPNGSLLAAGSSSGIVNIYNREEFLGGKRKPMKTIENLTTKVDFLKFNHDAQILAMCSTMQKNSLKLSWWRFHGHGEC
ncbi:hypothetical protein AQUCO_01700607v1 [Aquilegia coerulea]|uniref:U3 small nucleolar RNA-associated protein 18 homolog n=1 Tax=Aquilegia coerulea TaxID=218851 RepID=A0A2G5DNT7_AQUCA|nr:hypothetical protein AQUCO_01700607v1 [Aquilegia coerulea]